MDQNVLWVHKTYFLYDNYCLKKVEKKNFITTYYTYTVKLHKAGA